MSTSVVAPKKTLSFIDELLADQQQPDTPVARFSTAHAAVPPSGASPAPQSAYRDLIPLTAPRPGEQYAFEVDLDSCTGCKAHSWINRGRAVDLLAQLDLLRLKVVTP